jgi:ribosome-associated toxin RatA of RatAB toxin-antitoxin module
MVRLLGINILNLIRNLIPVTIGLIVVWNGPAGARSHDEIALANTTANSAGVKAQQLAQETEKSKHVARGIVQVQINAPREAVWSVLTNFSNYPEVFERIQSCKVTKKDGDLVFTESLLKPHMFLNQPCQHAVNDLTQGPNVLTWRAIDGNFKSMGGKWELRPSGTDNKCTAVYTLEVDAGNCIPTPLVGMLMKGMQKEIVASVKKTAELTFQGINGTAKLPSGIIKVSSARRNG